MVPLQQVVVSGFGKGTTFFVAVDWPLVFISLMKVFQSNCSSTWIFCCYSVYLLAQFCVEHRRQYGKSQTLFATACRTEQSPQNL